jgi:glutamate/tyrosine decarboxylase-like PLP-dependent enzyme
MKKRAEKLSPTDAEKQTSLDISAAAMEALSSQTVALVSEYFEHIAELPVFPEVTGGETALRLGRELPREGEPIAKLLNDCRAIFDRSRHNGHPRFFGYVASPATAPGAFADLIASTLNANVTSWRSGPAATEVERLVVRWLGSLVGFSEDAHGLLTSGGSMANLTALLIALRTKAATNAARGGLWQAGPPMTIYASDQIHLSIAKAADILGIGRDQVRLIESDDRFQLNVKALRAAIRKDRKNNFIPFCVVGSAGTVNTGAIDPLSEIADVAQEFGLWFHVDGAYGALGALDPKKRPRFAGIDRADSVSLDPHKWLYTPLDSGCLLFRDRTAARATFANDEADYVKVHEQADDEAFAFWDYGIELSRRFRALKIWLTLRYYGIRRIAEAISHDMAMAEYLAQCVSKAKDFELLAPVELSICCFRFLPAKLRAKLTAARGKQKHALELEIDDLNTRVMLAVQRGGYAYISNATVKGKFALRACITNFRTTRANIDETLEIIRDAAQELSPYRDGG